MLRPSIVPLALMLALVPAARAQVPGVAAPPDPEVWLDGERIDPEMVRREALWLFASKALEDQTVRLGLEDLTAWALERGLAVPVRRATDPIATDDWILELLVPPDASRFLPLEELGWDESEMARIYGELAVRFRPREAGEEPAPPLSIVERPLVLGALRAVLSRDPRRRETAFEFPPGMAVVAGGSGLSVAEAWERFGGGIGAPHLRYAGLWCARLELVRRELDALGGALDQHAWRAWSSVFLGRGDLRDALIRFWIQAELNLPSTQAVRSYFWLEESFRRLRFPTFDRRLLEEPSATRSAIFPAGTMDLDVILFSAVDAVSALPLEDSAWTAAEERARACKLRLDAGEEFDALLAELSEFPDFPIRSSPLLGDNITFAAAKGKLGPSSPARARGALGGLPAERFVFGRDPVPELFQLLEVGQTYGPVRTALGWALLRPRERVPAEGDAPALRQPGEIDLYRKAFERESFLRWVEEISSRHQVEIRG